MSTPNDSPLSIQPLHNPSQAAHTQTNQPPGMGTKAFLAKKMAKAQLVPVSPLISDCVANRGFDQQPHFHLTHGQSHDSCHSETQCRTEEELHQVRCGPRSPVVFVSILNRGAAKPTQLFAQPDGHSDDEEADETQPATNPKEIAQDDENPF